MLGHGVRVAAGHLADNHATPGAFAYVNMVVARRPRGDKLKRRMRVEECCIDLGGDVYTENFSIGLNLSYPSEKSQIVLGERGLEEILLGLLGLGELYLHGEWPSALKGLSSHSRRMESALSTS